MAKRKPQELTPRNKIFVSEYIVDFKGKQAAIRAGFPPKSAHSRASELLRSPAIKAAIDDAIEARSKRTEITADRVLEELFHVFTSNIENYEAGDANSPVRLKKGVSPEAMRAVSSVKKTVIMGGWAGEDGETAPKLEKVDIKLWDKPKAIALAMRHLGMLNDKLTINVNEELEKVITSAADDYDRKIASIASRIKKKEAAG